MTSHDTQKPLQAVLASRTNFLDFFLPKAAGQNSDHLYRGRILIGTCLSIGTGLLAILAYAMTSPMSPEIKYLTATIMLPVGLFVSSIALIYKYSGAYALCSNFLVFFSYTSISMGLAITGGPIISPAAYTILIPSMFAFFLLGKRAGLAWTATVLATYIGLSIITGQGLDLPNTVDPNLISAYEIACWAFVFIVITSVTMAYEGIQVRLKKERDTQEQRFMFLATHDGLTELPNRLLFYDRAEQAMARSKRQEKPFALLYVAVNGMKEINDQYSHKAGDHVLKTVASRLQQAIRETDLIARFDGNEFVVIIEQLQKDHNADSIAEKIIHYIAEQITFNEDRLYTSCNIGISYYPKDAAVIDTLLNQADEAMKYGRQHQIAITRHDKLAPTSKTVEDDDFEHQ